jgi:hypothetical protein
LLTIEAASVAGNDLTVTDHHQDIGIDPQADDAVGVLDRDAAAV